MLTPKRERNVANQSSCGLVHADRNAVGGERAGEGRASELRALVGIEDVRLAVTSHSILQRLHVDGRLRGRVHTGAPVKADTATVSFDAAKAGKLSRGFQDCEQIGSFEQNELFDRGLDGKLVRSAAGAPAVGTTR